MLLAWLCVACAGAAAEWVQISQQHYRKPAPFGTQHNIPSAHTTRDQFNGPSTRPTRTSYLSQDEPTRETYFNHSLTEHDWNQDLQRPNRRGELGVGSNVWNEPQTPDEQNDDTNKQDERTKNGVKDGVSELGKLKDEAVSGKVERIPNIGSVKRVHLVNTPVKSPSVKVNPGRNADRRLNDNGFIDTKHSYEDTVLIKPVINNKHTFGTIDEDFSQIANNRTATVSKEKTEAPVSNSQILSFIHQPDTDAHKVTQVSKFDSRYKQNNNPDKSENPFRNTGADTDRNKRPAKVQKISNINDEIVDVPANKKVSIETASEERIHEDTVKKKSKLNDKENVDKSNSENGETNSSSNEIKVNTMENILKFMKVVTETISKNTRRGANSKVMYLNELKHTLLANIQERIDSLFPDAMDDVPGTRRSRSAQARGHVQVPSSESALMTISFLTFAVFLIKLVLQVIQTYKHKMVMAPLMVATAGRTLAKKLRSSN